MDNLLETVVNEQGEILCYKCPRCSKTFQPAERGLAEECATNHLQQLNEG